MAANALVTRRRAAAEQRSAAEPGRLHLDAGAQFHDVEDFLQRDADRRLPGGTAGAAASVATNAPAPAASRPDPRRGARRPPLRTTVRLTPMAATIACSVGRRAPGGNCRSGSSSARRSASHAAGSGGGTTGRIIEIFSARLSRVLTSSGYGYRTISSNNMGSRGRSIGRSGMAASRSWSSGR